MKAIMVMFDTLNRHMLPPYGGAWVHAPNFQRLAERTVTFDNSFVGSMPCMPARRELHTGRYNFLHRSWGPIEPFDDSTPEILKGHGIYTHLATDHYHYWEEGGCNYHTRYNSAELVRGQEGDRWIGDLRTPTSPRPNSWRDDEYGRHDWVNRRHMAREADQPQPQTFEAGLKFLEYNHDADNWFLQIETFDPHEPYFTNPEFKALYDFDFSQCDRDWPRYEHGDRGQNALSEHLRMSYAALVSMCDKYLGKVLDAMDRYGLWEDTLLIVNTDHGFMLGEHDWWGKCLMPFYDEIAHTPLFVWDPRCGVQNERRRSLVQTIDLPATLLEYFGVELPPDMQGMPLRRTVADDRPVREAGLYGVHGGHVNVTDGRYTYFRAPVRPDNRPLYNYTHMPTHMRHTFGVEEMRTATLAEPFAFTKGCPTMRIDAGGGRWGDAHRFGTLLFDIVNDPGQRTPLNDPDVERMMLEHLVRELKKNAAPAEQYERLGLSEVAGRCPPRAPSG
jgi:arylsulfatase A-like enzyme